MYNQIDFCHIIPNKLLPTFHHYNGCHLILAHLVAENEEYRNFYANLYDGKTKIMDNSAFEMFKQDKPMYESSELIKLGKMVNADMLVMSDYPKESGVKTIQAADDLAYKFKEKGFGTFFCPQSQLGDMDDLMLSFEWALRSPMVDRIGISILNAPIACGIMETAHGEEHTRSDAFRLQRYLSRWSIFKMLKRWNLLEKSYKKFHCLGMTDGPREIELLEEFHPYIASWDSSAAVWAAINGVEFDKSPTGLQNGKFELEVDFEWEGLYDPYLVRHNIQYINKLCTSSL